MRGDRYRQYAQMKPRLRSGSRGALLRTARFHSGLKRKSILLPIECAHHVVASAVKLHLQFSIVVDRAAAQVGNLAGDNGAIEVSSAVQFEVSVGSVDQGGGLGASVNGHSVRSAVQNLEIGGDQ